MYKIHTAFACTFADVCRNAVKHVIKIDKDVQLRMRMRDLAQQHRIYDAPRLHALLKREDLVVNLKTYRTHLPVREVVTTFKGEKKKAKLSASDAPRPQSLVMSIGASDSLLDERRIRILTMMIYGIVATLQ